MQLNQAFLFLRHGQTDWNIQRRLQGRSDRPLDATGVEQAHIAAGLLAGQKVRLIVSSPLLRAEQTASIVSEKLDVPVRIDHQLTERSFGSLEGRPLSDIAPGPGRGLDIASSENLPPDAEPWDQVRARVLRATANWLAEHEGQRLLFVSHFGVMCALCQQLCGGPRPARNATPYLFSPTSRRDWELVEIAG